jgi:hypothetical protein
MINVSRRQTTRARLFGQVLFCRAIQSSYTGELRSSSGTASSIPTCNPKIWPWILQDFMAIFLVLMSTYAVRVRLSLRSLSSLTFPLEKVSVDNSKKRQQTASSHLQGESQGPHKSTSRRYRKTLQSSCNPFALFIDLLVYFSDITI